jgi:nucleotide sugar dehydrogenase
MTIENKIKQKQDIQIGRTNGNTKVLVVGMGQLGLPVALYVKQCGFDVYGHDISLKAVQRASDLGGIKAASNFKEFDMYIICVATHDPQNIFAPQTESLFSVVSRIAEEGKTGALISIESTVPKGTSRRVLEMIGHRLHVVHAPHRWWAEDQNTHGVNQTRVIGGVEECCLHEGLGFYGIADADSDRNPSIAANLGIPMHVVPNIEVAELTKIIENAHRYLQIAFAEDLFLWCQAEEIEFKALRTALNTKWNVDILEPRKGIGGHCLPKDTRMFLYSSQRIRSKILDAAIEVDQEYALKVGKELTTPQIRRVEARVAEA